MFCTFDVWNEETFKREEEQEEHICCTLMTFEVSNLLTVDKEKTSQFPFKYFFQILILVLKAK